MKALFVDVAGIRTRCIEAGEGDTLILLHGIGMSADCFHRNVDALAATRRVLAIDMLGHGFTGFDGFSGPPLIAMARHVLATMDALSIDQADIAGSSLGGGIAVLCALLAPRRVRSCLVVGSSTPFVSAERLGVGLGKARENAGESFRTGTLEALHRRLRYLVHDESGVSETVLANQLTIYAQADRATAYNAIVDSVQAAGADLSQVAEHRLAELTIPVLALTGREDVRSPLQAITEGVGRLRFGRLIVYDRCGHFPFLEHPDRFNADVGNFLASLVVPP